MTLTSVWLPFSFFFSIFLLTWQSMTVPNFMSKAFSYQDLCREYYVPLPGAWQDKNTPGQLVLEKVKKMKDAIILSMLTSQRQYFADLYVFIFCFDFLAATNTDWLCILLLPTDCSLNVIKKSCIIHPPLQNYFAKTFQIKEITV